MKKMVWLVTAKSGIHFGNCVLGVGASKREAISDATGGDTRLVRGLWLSRGVLPSQSASM